MGMRTLTTAAAAVMAAALASAGCGDGTTGGGGGDPLTGRTFLSETITEDGEPYELVEGTRIALEFTDDGRLVARAGCNILSHDVSVTGDRIEATGGESTEMGCDPPRQEQDTWLADFLSGSPQWELDGDYLILTSGGTELELLDRQVADPDRPLAGTRWVVGTIFTGDVASSMIAGTEGSAWLLIEGDTFTASSGCRDFQGAVSVGGTHLEFRDTTQTDPECAPELTEVDEAMRTILTARVEFTLSAAQLHLIHPDGVGLELSADG